MGKGRKPTPPHIRLLEGSRPRNRTKPDEMAIICPGVPEPPPHITGIALEHWRYVANHLGRASLLELLDLGQLSNLCIAYELTVLAKDHIDAHGAMIVDMKTGNIKRNPACAILAEAQARYHSISAEFGLSPSSRAKLKMPPKNAEDDELEKFLG